MEQLTANLQSQYDNIVADIREDQATLADLNAKRDALVAYKNFLTSYRDTINLPCGFETLACVLDVSRGVFVTEMSDTLILNDAADSLSSNAYVFGDSLDTLISSVQSDIYNLDADIATIVLQLDDFGTDIQTVMSSASALGIVLVLAGDLI